MSQVNQPTRPTTSVQRVGGLRSAKVVTAVATALLKLPARLAGIVKEESAGSAGTLGGTVGAGANSEEPAARTALGRWPAVTTTANGSESSWEKRKEKTHKKHR